MVSKIEENSKLKWQDEIIPRNQLLHDYQQATDHQEFGNVVNV